MDPLRPGLYAIVDVPHPHGLAPAEVTRAILDGAPELAALQLRAKGWDTAHRVRALRAMAPLAAAAGVPLWVNDDLEAALAAGPAVAGVHLGVGDPGWDDVHAVRRQAADRRAR